MEDTKQSIREERCVRRVGPICVEYQTYYNNRTLVGWDDVTRTALREALDIVSERFLTTRVWHCALTNASTWIVENAAVPVNTTEQFREWFAQQKNGLLDMGFPHVTIQINHLPKPWVGAAEVGAFVNSRWNGQQRAYQVTGKYHIQMDDAFMRSGRGPERIASVIAHELLHQMGHTHKAHNDGNFVVTYQNCLLNDGKFVPEGLGLHGHGASAEAQCGAK